MEVYRCALHGECALRRIKTGKDVRQCLTCGDREEPPVYVSTWKWAVGITTAPREQSTLQRTIDSLAAAGWENPLVFAEPGVAPADRCVWSPNNKRQGGWNNWKHAARHLLEQDADAILLCQDDVVFTRNLRQFLETSRWPEGSVLSPYCSKSYENGAAGWRPGGCIGALTYVFRPRELRSLLRSRRGRRSGHKGIDSKVGQWAKRDRGVFFHVPSLAQHIGDTSTLWPRSSNAGIRRAVSFPGEHFDAMSLSTGDKRFTTDWVSHHVPTWVEALSHLRGLPDVTALEIGSYEGRSACWFAENLLTGRGAVLHCVDSWDGYIGNEEASTAPAEAMFDENARPYLDRGRIVKHKSESFAWLAGRLASGDREMCDFIYVDGSHEAGDALADLSLCWGLLKPGATLIFDDYRKRRDCWSRRPGIAMDAFAAARADLIEVHTGAQKIVRKAHRPLKIHLMMTASRPGAPAVLEAVRRQLPIASAHVHWDAPGDIVFPGDVTVTRTAGLGKRRYAECVTTLFRAAPPADLYLFVQDDIEPMGLERLPTLWSRLPTGAAAIYLVSEAGRNSRAGWCRSRPREQFNGEIDISHWLDCIAFAAAPHALASIRRHVPTPPASRWASDPGLSSGVGQYLTRQWLKKGVYQVRESLVRHGLHRSAMHPQRPLLDTPTSERVIGLMATVPWRSDTLPHVVESLEGQLHELRIYAGDCDVPDSVRSRKWVKVIRGPNVGDRGRWRGAEGIGESSYILCLDDDIAYPRDYAPTLLTALEAHGRSIVVGVHGRIFRRAQTGDYFGGTRRVLHFKNQLSDDTWVHVLGSGTLAYHASLLRLSVEDFPQANMSDAILARLLEGKRIPRQAVARSARWLRPLQPADKRSIYASGNNHADQNEIVASIAWALPPMGASNQQPQPRTTTRREATTSPSAANSR